MLLQKVLSALSIRGDVESFDNIHAAVEQDVEFRGGRLWILIFAILLASAGLNINSTAVIIGAMLISPLMGPINGMGYSIATYDFKLFRRAVQNITFAVMASLVASALYFAVSPVSSAHSELLARTSPTIYDVLIALFGGMAGTMSLTTRLKGNVVPGVAIATALMPPLCTAGYGLATWQLGFFFGALYLFTINTVFIALSTVAFSQVMKFPIRGSVDEARKSRINRWITAITLVTLVPSLYFGFVLVEKERFQENATKFLRSVSVYRGDYLLRQEVDADRRVITMVYGGRSMTREDQAELRKRATEFGLEKATIELEQAISLADFSQELSRELNESERMKSEINRLTLALQQNARRQDSLLQRSYTGRQLLDELRPIFPQVDACLFTEPYRFSVQGNGQPERLAYVVVSSNKTIGRSERIKIDSWLKVRLQNDSLETVFTLSAP